jgi:hypothetical protein
MKKKYLRKKIINPKSKLGECKSKPLSFTSTLESMPDVPRGTRERSVESVVSFSVVSAHQKACQAVWAESHTSHILGWTSSACAN